MMAGMPVTPPLSYVSTVRAGDLVAVGHVSVAPEAPHRAVVLVHGLGSSSRAFRRMVPLLAAQGQVHALDLPGYGDSPRTGRDVPVHDHAAVVAQYVRTHVLEAGMPAPVIVGHSMGAQVVAQLLADHPDVASAGVLLGPTSDTRARSLPRQAWRLAVDAVGEPPRTLGVLLVDTLLRCRPPYFLAQLRHVVAHHIEDALAGVSVPVVVVRGRNDPVAPQSWGEQLATVTRGELRTVDGRHHAMDGDPEGVAAAVADAWSAAGVEVS